MCGLCKSKHETGFHLFFSYQFSRVTWNFFCTAFWVRGKPSSVKSSLGDWLIRGIPKNIRQCWIVIMGVILQSIWNVRKTTFLDKALPQSPRLLIVHIAFCIHGLSQEIGEPRRGQWRHRHTSKGGDGTKSNGHRFFCFLILTVSVFVFQFYQFCVCCLFSVCIDQPLCGFRMFLYFTCFNADDLS